LAPLDLASVYFAGWKPQDSISLLLLRPPPPGTGSGGAAAAAVVAGGSAVASPPQMGPTCCRLHTGDPSPHAIRCEYPRCYFQLRPFVWCFLQWSGSSVGWSLDLSRHCRRRGREASNREVVFVGFERRWLRSSDGVDILARRHRHLHIQLSMGSKIYYAPKPYHGRRGRRNLATFRATLSFRVPHPNFTSNLIRHFFRGLDSTSHARFLSRPWRSQADASPNRTTEDPTFQFDR
jgi:hypothetical protein